MKIVFINSRFLHIGGGETYMMELMEHFSFLGWEVHLITKTDDRRLLKWNECHIHYIDGLDDQDLRPSSCLKPLRDILDEVKPDIVHVHDLMNFYAYSSVVEKGEFPAILTIHDTPLLPERLFGRLKDYRTECVFACELLANGKYSKVTFASKYYLDSYLEVAPWLKDTAEVAYGFPTKITAGPMRIKKLKKQNNINILFPSRIVERKGIEDCLHMLALLPEQFRMYLPAYSTCESKEYLSYINSLIDRLGIRKRVVAAVEKTPPEAMSKYYKLADIAVMPSHYEGFGLVAVESMTWGVPVIATPVGGLAEIITNNKNGLLVQPQSPKALADAVMKIATDPLLRKKLTKQALLTVTNNFTREANMKQMEKLYVTA